MMATDWKWNIRPANGDDLNFIYSTWLNSLWADCESARGPQGPTFFSQYPRIIDHLLGSPSTQTVIACHFEDPNVIFGYLVASPPVAHYTFVKSNFRRYGIAKALIDHLKSGSEYTHRTGLLQVILRNKPTHSFNPYLLYTKGDPDHGTA